MSGNFQPASFVWNHIQNLPGEVNRSSHLLASRIADLDMSAVNIEIQFAADTQPNGKRGQVPAAGHSRQFQNSSRRSGLCIDADRDTTAFSRSQFNLLMIEFNRHSLRRFRR